MNIEEYENWENEEYCRKMAEQDGLALQYVKEQTEKICELAATQNGLALQYVKEQTEKICEIAVKQDGLALQYVKIRDVFVKLLKEQEPESKACPTCGKVRD